MQHQEISPQQRLALSRQAMLRYMQNGNHDLGRPQSHDSNDAHDAYEAPNSGRSHWDILKHTVKVWWHHHPANIAYDMVQPLVKIYAAEHPFKILAVSAGVGAAAVLIKPWRLVSVSALLVSAMRSSNISSVVMTLLTSSIYNATANQSDTNAADNPTQQAD
ncbi:hypothetical protein [Polaromonas vacuolata]|nr:hypothetical protein [Polaromonas vacuolata]